MKVTNIRPLTQNTLAERIYQQIKKDIITGVIPQGQKIVEGDLAESYHASRGPLREALHKLESINLVVRKPHSGSKVVVIDKQMMKDVYQMREAMEGFASRLAACIMSQKEIDNLYRLLEHHEQSIKQTNSTAYFQEEGNLDFHFYIFSRCQNQWLINYLENELYQILRMCRHRTSQISFRVDVALQDHHNIVDAINNRDPEFTEILMRRHIKGAWKTIEAILETPKSKTIK